jgi:hypothetical protein
MLLASLLLLAGCATQSAVYTEKPDTVAAAYSKLATQYPQVTDGLRKTLVALMKSKLGVIDDPAVDCMTASYLGGISEEDLSVVETGIATHYMSPEYLRVAKRLFGPSVLHGEIVSAAAYKDGTSRDFEAEHVVDARVQDVARKLCPATLTKYPRAFGY